MQHISHIGHNQDVPDVGQEVLLLTGVQRIVGDVLPDKNQILGIQAV